MLTSLQQAHNLSGWEVSPTKVDQCVMQNFNPFFILVRRRTILMAQRDKNSKATFDILNPHLNCNQFIIHTNNTLTLQEKGGFIASWLMEFILN